MGRWRAGAMVPRMSLRLDRGRFDPKEGLWPQQGSIAARLRAMEIACHFESCEWRLSSGANAGFDHVVLLRSGEALLGLPGGDRHVLAPAIVWVPAGSADRLAIQAGSSGWILAIGRDLIEQTFRQMTEATELLGLLVAKQPLDLPIEADRAAILAHTLSLVCSELQTLRPGSQTLITSALVICFVELWRRVGGGTLAREGSGGATAVLMRFRQLVEEHFREHWAVARYARAVGVSPDRLHAICTRVLDRPPRLLIQQRLVYEAVVRLERSAITIKQLAFILGFRDAAYFNRFFSQHIGVPPARYRRGSTQRDTAGRAPEASFTFADWP